MESCKRCGSYAINHHLHGRNGKDRDLCDVCYWRKRVEAENAELRRLIEDVAIPAIKPFADCCGEIYESEDDEDYAKFKLVVRNYRDALGALTKLQEAVK